MDPNATLKVSPERLAELASVDPDVTPGPAAALRQIGSVRPAPLSTRPSAPSHPGAFSATGRASSGATRPRKPSAFGTVVLYVLLAVVVAAAVIGLIALVGRLMQ